MNKASLLVGLVLVAGCSHATRQASTSMTAPSPDPRVGLRPGWWDAAQASWNMRLVSSTRPSEHFVSPTAGDFAYMNSDLSFSGNYVIQGNFNGYQVWDVSNPSRPALHTAFVCPGSQSDVSVWRNLMFVSSESTNGRIDCGTQGVPDTVSHDRVRGIRIFDITDIAHPRHITDVQTCRGSHTHTVVENPRDPANIYVYISGSAPVRSPNELPGCSGAPMDRDPNSALFRIEVIQVPVAHPEQAHIVSSPRIFNDLVAPATHGDAPEDSIANANAVATARTRGAFIFWNGGREQVVPDQVIRPMLDSLVRVRGGTGAPSGADSLRLRTWIDSISTRNREQFASRNTAARPGPTQCHDITVYPAIGRAGGACGGYGLLLDITDPVNPRRIGAAADSNFSYWHSATFNNDGTKILFTDEWGGGLAPRCRSTDRKEWGADAIFTLQNDRMTFHSYYKLPAPQTAQENCVAHNGSLIPVPGRDIMVQGWYQGGISVFDFTDADHPVEIAYFDRGPMDSTRLEGAGSWSAYWYNGHIYSSEIARGLDILDLLPSAALSRNEIDAARAVHVDFLNVQDQQRFTWPANVAVPRAYLDQLERSNLMPAEQIAAARAAIDRAEHQSGAARRATLAQLADELGTQARGAAAGKVGMLADAVRSLANPGAVAVAQR